MLNEGLAKTLVLAIVQTATIMLNPAWARLPLPETCKDNCECDSIVLRVDCTGADLEKTPDIRNNTRNLILDSNQLEMINKTDFAQMKNLRSLSLVNNSIDEIESNSFLYSRKIVKLNLDGNLFGEVPVALEHLRELKELTLSNNQIRTLSREPWCNLTHLERLHLDSNGIPNLPLVMTSKLTQLIEFSVSHNNITSIPYGQFFNMSNLEYLDLSYNNLELATNPSSSNDNVDVESVVGYLPYMYASDLPTAVPDKDYAIDDMAEGIVIDSFKGLSGLKVLNLKGNRIHELVTGVLNDMPELHTLLLDDNGIERIEDDVFRNHIHLRFLSLASNMLSHIPQMVFEHLRDLEVLFLDNNYITDMAPMTNIHMFHLRKLSINHNRIKHIAPPGFRHFISLEEIYINHNILIEFPNVQNITNLTILDVGHNRIKHISPINVFDGTSMREIYVNNNRLKSVDFSTFNNLEHLVVLDVTGYNYICDCQLNWIADFVYEYDWMFMPNGKSLDETMVCQSPNMLKELYLYDRLFMGLRRPTCTQYADPHRVVLLVASWGGVVVFFLLMFWAYVYFDFKKRFYVRKPRKRYLLIHNIDENTGLPYHHNHPSLLKEQHKVRFRSCESDTESLDMLNCNYFDEETTV